MKKQLWAITASLLFVTGLFADAAPPIKQQKSENGVQLAPDFTLPDQNGSLVNLSAILETHRGAVIAFYPKDDTPG